MFYPKFRYCLWVNQIKQLTFETIKILTENLFNTCTNFNFF